MSKLTRKVMVVLAGLIAGVCAACSGSTPTPEQAPPPQSTLAPTLSLEEIQTVVAATVAAEAAISAPAPTDTEPEPTATPEIIVVITLESGDVVIGPANAPIPTFPPNYEEARHVPGYYWDYFADSNMFGHNVYDGDERIGVVAYVDETDEVTISHVQFWTNTAAQNQMVMDVEREVFFALLGEELTVAIFESLKDVGIECSEDGQMQTMAGHSVLLKCQDLDEGLLLFMTVENAGRHHGD